MYILFSLFHSLGRYPILLLACINRVILFVKVSPPCSRSSAVIWSGLGLSFCWRFLSNIWCHLLWNMLLRLVSVFSRMVVISFSPSFLKVLSWLLLIVLLMWCCFSFSDILQSSKMYVFVVLSSMGSTMLFFLLPRTLLYLCRN